MSPRVRELSRQLKQVTDEFRRRYAMSDAEIRQALLQTAGRSGGRGGRRPAVALVAGAVAALVGLGVFASQTGTRATGLPWVEIAVGVVVVGVLVALLRNR